MMLASTPNPTPIPTRKGPLMLPLVLVTAAMTLSAPAPFPKHQRDAEWPAGKWACEGAMCEFTLGADGYFQERWTNGTVYVGRWYYDPKTSSSSSNSCVYLTATCRLIDHERFVGGYLFEGWKYRHEQGVIRAYGYKYRRVR